VIVSSLATQTITVLRAGTVTDHGTTVPDWTAATTHDVAGCSVQPATGREERTNRDAITSVWRVYGPSGADVRDSDRVRWGGVDYDIDGPVQRWSVGFLDHIEFALRAVAG
jgi:hypothetical protein